ncbi:MAG: hypothetical protein ACRYG8_35160 [Janthinobacterium lividum]
MFFVVQSEDVYAEQPDRARRPVAVCPFMGRKGNAKNRVKGTLAYIALLRQ